MGLPVVDLVDHLTTNLITTLHTVLPSPTRTQEQIIEELWTHSDFTVVPTHAARDLLATRYSLYSRSVRVIPHGTDPFLGSVARLRMFQAGDTGQPRLLTWGLIGPGKGLEWSIRAVGQLKTRHPDISYTIAGKTHPKVVQNEGESYRRFLERLVSELGLEENVRFIDEYVSSGLLRDLLTGTGVVVLPYDSTDQIVSGVLVEAIAANVPVVATNFPHAVELAEEGTVSAVPHRDPDAIARAISSLLESGGAWGRMMKAQRAIAPNLEWGHVAREYERLVNDVVTRPATMSHVSPAS
jgi:glycosyltransferase involved in cell wall biosynthesis